MSILTKANTRPPGADESAVRSIWTAKDEAALLELAERKQRIMLQRREVLAATLAPVLSDLSPSEIDAVLDSMINIAEALRDALLPFDGRRT